jgi:tetratricopeptide (TPR) repeat protein
MSTRGYYYDGKIFGNLAVEFAQQRKKIIDLAWLLVHGIGWIDIHSGNLTKAEARIREGLKLYKSLKNSEGVRDALHNLGLVLRYKGDFNAARIHYEKGMAMSKSIPDDLGIAMFKRGLSILDSSEGRLSEAKKELESILPILRAKDELSLAGTLANLADVNCKLKDYETAVELGLEGLKLAKKMKKRFTFAWISRILAKTETERGNSQSAISFAKQALEYYEKSGFFYKEAEEVKSLIKELQEKLAEKS